MVGVLISTDTTEHFHQHRAELYWTMPWPCSKTQALRILWVTGPESGRCAGLFSGSILLKVDHIAGVCTHRPERWLRGEERRGSLGAQELGSSSPCTAWRAGESENLNPSLAFQAFVMMCLSEQAGRLSFTEQFVFLMYMVEIFWYVGPEPPFVLLPQDSQCNKALAPA